MITSTLTLRAARYFVAVAELKFLHLTPEPKPVSVGTAALKANLSPGAEKFWQWAKEAGVGIGRGQ